MHQASATAPRRSRYRGSENPPRPPVMPARFNLIRMHAYLDLTPLDIRRTSHHLARLAPASA